MIESANSPSPQAFGFNALSDAFIKDPLPFMTKGLSEHPIVKHDVTLDPVYSIFRYEDVKRVLLDWETFSSEPINTDLDALNLGRATENFILMNPPRHTRLRGLAQQGFFPKVIKKFLPRAEQIAKERFEYALKVDEFDLVNDVSSQLTIGMITGILGLPADDWSRSRSNARCLAYRTASSA